MTSWNRWIALALLALAALTACSVQTGGLEWHVVQADVAPNLEHHLGEKLSVTSVPVMDESVVTGVHALSDPLGQAHLEIALSEEGVRKLTDATRQARGAYLCTLYQGRLINAALIQDTLDQPQLWIAVPAGTAEANRIADAVNAHLK